MFDDLFGDNEMENAESFGLFTFMEEQSENGTELEDEIDEENIEE